MVVGRWISCALLGCLAWAGQVGAQNTTGTVTGRVVDSVTQQPVTAANVRIEGTNRGTLTSSDGRFLLAGLPAGAHRVRVSRIGFGAQVKPVTVTEGGTTTVDFALGSQAAVLAELVTVGYGTRRREAITGSVASVNTTDANVGVVPSVTEMLRGRVAGVSVTQNSGEPGAGSQIRIRGGTSISASNEPLYVIDGVPINNTPTEPGGIGIGGSPPLPRNPLTLLNPSDIASISILKDATSAAIYGSRGANGVILIETKKGVGGASSIDYEVYTAVNSAARHMKLLNGDEYRQFVQQQIQAGALKPDRLATLGSANTDWDAAVTRSGVTQNHNLSFAGGGVDTRYRASLNYMDDQGVIRNNGLQRYQGRLNGTHQTLGDRLRLGLNLTATHEDNKYLPYENTGGFEGGVFTNVAIFNPTQPVRITDPVTGQSVFYEVGQGSQSVRNPVALAEQIRDVGATTRSLGNVTADYDLLPSLTAKINVGIDRSEGSRRTYWPMASPVGAQFGGRARQANRDNTSATLQTLLTFHKQVESTHDLLVVGGYEYTRDELGEFGTEGRGFITDALGFNNLGGGTTLQTPFSWREDSRTAAFFSRAEYGYNDRYFLTGVIRRDGSSRFGVGNKWATFPSVSAAWRISQEDFMRNSRLSELRLRGGVGTAGNPGVPPYASLILLEPSGGSRYVFGEQVFSGVSPTRNSNPKLKWEQTRSYNIALDYGFLNDRLSGTLEYYVKNTSDLLLTVAVPQPAVVSSRLENIGSLRNRGVEFSMEGQIIQRPSFGWTAGINVSRQRNEVTDLGGRTFISTAGVSGQGQSGQVAQRIMPGYALGTFYGPQFVGVNAQGQQLFNQYKVVRDALGRDSIRTLTGTTTTPGGDDFVVIGDANPKFTFGVNSRVNRGNFDFSFQVNSEIGRDVFNNTALVYSTKGNGLQNKNFLKTALTDNIGIKEPAIYSSKWIENGSFARLQNVTIGYTFDLPGSSRQVRSTRLFVSGDNLLLLTGYSGIDPEVHTEAGLASRGIDYLTYPRPRTYTAGVHVAF